LPDAQKNDRKISRSSSKALVCSRFIAKINWLKINKKYIVFFYKRLKT
jgi:hypothetical protein